MLTGSPKVTVMMPVHNAEKYLARSIQSVLDQNYSSFELIIYDDGSSDGSYGIAEKFCRQDSRVRLLGTKINRGVSYARNRVLRAARGKYIAPQDADDIMMRFRLKHLSQFLDTHPDIGVVFGGACWFGGGQMKLFRPWVKTAEEITHLYRSERVSGFPWFHHGASLFRRALALKIGGYNRRLKTSEDMDFFFRLFKKTHFFYLNRLYYMYRLNSRGVSTRHTVTVAKRQREFEKSCKCEVLKIGGFRIRVFFDQKGFYERIKKNFIKGSLLRARNENIVSGSKRKITIRIKKTTSHENGLDLEIIYPEIVELRKKGCFSLLEIWKRRATIYHLPNANKRLSAKRAFEMHFMKPLLFIISRYRGAAGRGGLVSKNGEGILILNKKGANGNWIIPFLAKGYKYLSNDYLLFQMDGKQLAGYGIPTRIPFGKHLRKQAQELGSVYWDKSVKKYYLEPKERNRKMCFIKTVIFPRRSSKKNLSIKRLTRNDFKRRLMAEKSLGDGNQRKAVISLLLKQAKAYEIAYGKENFSKCAEQILLNMNQESR